MNRKSNIRIIVVYVCFLCSLLLHGMVTWGGDASFEAEIEKNNHYDNTNWMSGIADGRYLHEINIPGAHDATTKNVWAYHTYTSWDSKYATTQCYTITELLNIGVRMLDLRVTNCQRNIKNASTDSLFMCHGEYHALNVDGLFYCVDANERLIELNDVLKDVKSWLVAHPSETVLLDFTCEYEDSNKSNNLPKVYNTLKKVIDNNSWIYQERNIPKLGDVRGRAVAISSHRDELGCGLNVNTYQPEGCICNGTHFYSENHFDLGPKNKMLKVIDFYENHKDRLKPELSSSVADSPLYYVMTSSNNWQFIGGDCPKDIAEVVNSVVDGAGGVLTDRTGRKLGWVYSDFICDTIKEKHQSCAANIWKSNYPEYKTIPGNEDFYYTLTYKDQKGQTLGVQHVLKGAAAVLPTNVMGEKNYVGWMDEANQTDIYQGTIIPKKNMVLVPQAGLSWASFKKWVNDHRGENVNYTLTGDLIAGNNDTEIALPENTTIHLNLNGHNVYAPSSRMAFSVDGWKSCLEITGPGTIYGGKDVKYQAGVIKIQNRSKVSLDQVTIRDAKCSNGAAAIWVDNGGTLSLKDTQITNNTGVQGAVYLMSRASLTVSGHTKIKGNSVKLNETTNALAGDVYLNEGALIGFSGKLASDAGIVVQIDNPNGTNRFTTGYGKWHDNPPSDYFEYVNKSKYDIDIMYIGEGQNRQLEGAVITHKHKFEITADGDHLNVICKNDACPLSKQVVTITLCKPQHCVYGDGLDCNATISNPTDEIKPIITYKEGDQELKEAPSKAGKYTAIMTIDGKSAFVSYEIKPRPVSIGGIIAKDKIYDGTNKAELSADFVMMDGLVKGDNLKLTDLSGEFEQVDVGRQSVRLSYSLGGESAANYTLIGAAQQNATSAEIYMKNQIAPDKPQSRIVSNHSITLQKVEGCEYRCGSGNWQESNTFAGLTENKEYEFYQRLKGYTNHNPSPQSTALKVTTTSYKWIYSVDTEHNKIIATCDAAYGTHRVGDKAELGLQKPQLEVYGQAGDNTIKEAIITGDVEILGCPDVDYYKATKTISAENIAIYTKNGGELEATPSDAGDYIAEIVLENDEVTSGVPASVSISVGYTIAPASGTISFKTKEVSKIFGDNSFINPLTNTGDGVVTYSISSSEPSGVAAVDEEGIITIKGAGTATVKATVPNSNNYHYNSNEQTYTLTINEADISILETPEAKNSVYTAKPQDLVSVGIALGGEMQYAIGTESLVPTQGWSTTIPSGTEIGTYYVWYNVVPDQNHDECAAECVKVTIEPVDKSELEEEIICAKALYEYIHNNEEYSDLEKDFTEAIIKAENILKNINVTEDQVDTVISNLFDLEKQVEDGMDMVDFDAANIVICEIELIGAVDNTRSCKNRIDEARKAYDKLNEYQRDLVINDETLFAAENTFNELLDDAKTKTKSDVEAVNPDKYVTSDKGKVRDAKAEAMAAIEAAMTSETISEVMTAFNKAIEGCVKQADQEAAEKAAAEEAARKAAEEAAKQAAQEPITILQTPTKVKVKAKKNKVTVSWKKIKKNKKGKKLLKQINRIQVQYSTDPGFPEGNTVTRALGKKKSSVKLKLQRKSTYYIRVRYVGNGGYSNWSGTKVAKTK